MSDINLNLNDAGEQRSFDVIPAGTIVPLCLTIKPGGAGDDGRLTKAKDGNSEHLVLELRVTSGEHAARKIFIQLTLRGTAPNHAEAARISLSTLKAIVESAKGIRPKDESDAAKAARSLRSLGDVDGLVFLARLGVRGPEGGFRAKNVITEIVTPDMQIWRKPEPPPASSTSTSSAPAQQAASTAKPAGAIARPDWAKRD
jgi:hypothetical protein